MRKSGYITCLCTVAKTCKKTFIFSFEDFLWLLDLHYSGNGYYMYVVLHVRIDPCSFIFDFGYMPVPSTIVCMYLYLND